MGIITQQCMYCDNQYGTKDSQGAPGGISHGICPKCAKLSDNQLDAIARSKKKPQSFSDFTKKK